MTDQERIEQLEDFVLYLAYENQRYHTVLAKRLGTRTSRLRSEMKHLENRQKAREELTSRNVEHAWNQFSITRDRLQEELYDHTQSTARRFNNYFDHRDRVNRELGWLWGLMIIVLILIVILFVAIAN